MDLLKLLLLFVAVVGTIAGIYYGYTSTARSINNRAFERYQYKPVNFLNGLVAVVPIGIGLLGWGMSETDVSNLVVGLIISAIGTLLLAGSIAKKTNWGTAVASVIMLYLGIVLSFVFILVLFVMFSGSSKKKART
jgi:hypothetical protein